MRVFAPIFCFVTGVFLLGTAIYKDGFHTVIMPFTAGMFMTYAFLTTVIALTKRNRDK